MKKLKFFSGQVLLLPVILFMASCGEPPGTMPKPRTGSIRVVALDSLLIDSIGISLDNIYIGKVRNPHVIINLYAGEHKVEVFTDDASADPQTVKVEDNKLTKAFFNIESTGPYINRKAPDFSLTDIDGNPVSISGLRGKVILLAFFEHT